VNRAIRLGRIGGAEVVADVSVLAVAAAVVVVLYVDFGAVYPDTGSAVVTAVAVLAGMAFVVSVLAHEVSHAIVARLRGLHVRRIRLLAFGGYTMIEGKSERPSDELIISASGPAVSLLLAGLLWLVSGPASGSPVVLEGFRFVAFVNLLIAAFNLIPGFPLDGGRVLRAGVWQFNSDRVRATAVAVQAGRAFGWLVIGAATLAALMALNPWALLGVLLGWYLVRSADRAGRRELAMAKADGLVAGDVMRATPDPVPGEMFVSNVVDLYQIGTRLRSLPVEVDGQIRGVLGESEVERLSPARQMSSRASSAMTRIGPGDVVDIGTPVDLVMGRPAGETGRLVVVNSGYAVGIIEAADLARAVEDVERASAGKRPSPSR
jgi:Zn-dependent protease